MKKITLAIVMMCPAAIWAQELKPIDVKPGLWENTATSEMSGMSMPAMPAISEDQLAKMPPAQRAQVEAMMKGGMGAPRTNVSKACITKEQLNKPLFGNDDKSCTYKINSSSSSNQMVHVECTRGTTKTAGDLNIDRVDSEHVKGNMLMKTTDSGATAGRGQNVNIKVTFSNKWLSSDCGDVKPGGMDK